MRDEGLGVWYGSQRVGHLQRGSGRRMEFEYSATWVRENGFAISRSLPLPKQELTDSPDQGHQFFANLLPEGRARYRLMQQHRLPDDDYELLRALGGECAGALVIVPEGQIPDPMDSPTYLPVDQSGLAKLVHQRGWDVGTLEGTRLPRLSLAGAQDKTPVALFDGLIHLPESTAPSTHIIKFDSVEYRNVLAYECYTAMLANAAGLSVVGFELCRSGSDRYALIERYDRILGRHRTVARLHQEDFCQALGYSSRQKYETNGGPSFARCFGLVRDVSAAPLDDLESLLRWQVFNVLAGNSDGHAKNLALLYDADGAIRLAPFYDLVPTRAIENIDHALALSVGGISEPGNVGPKHWGSLAETCDVRTSVVLSLVGEVAESLATNIARVREEFEDRHGRLPALDRVERIVHIQCRKARRGVTS